VSAGVLALAVACTAGAAATPVPPPPESATGWRVGSMASAGTWVGWQAGRIAAPVADGRTLPLTGALVGQGTGLAVGLLTRPDVPDAATWATLDAAAIAGHLAGSALADTWRLDPDSDRRARAGLELGLGLGAAGLARWRTHHGSVTPSAARMATGTLVGTAVGAALPGLLDEADAAHDAPATPRLGGAIGLIAGTVFPVAPQDPRTATAGLAWGVATASLLGGAGGRVPGPTGRTVSSLGIIVGSTAGVAAGVALQPSYGDPATRPVGVPLYLGITQLQAAGTGAAVGAWAAWRYPDDPSVGSEAGMMAFGAASAAGLAVPALGQLSNGASAAAGSAGAWAGGLTAAATRALRQERPRRGAASAIAGEVGTITAGLSLLGKEGPPIPQLAWVNGVGLLGVGVGTLVSFAVTSEPHTRAAASLTGGVVGLGAGLATAGRWAARPTVGPALPRWNLPRPTRWNARLDPAPWVTPAGEPGLAMTLVIEETHR